MKNNLLYLLPLLSVLIAGGCAKNNIINPAPVYIPSGTFAGRFTLFHYNTKTGLTDSSSANLNLSMEAATGFSVTGDTSTLHAGSHGSFVVNTIQNSMDFADFTNPSTGTPAKVHLNGIYNYVFDGTILQIAANGPLDTLTYYYKMKKTGN